MLEIWPVSEDPPSAGIRAQLARRRDRLASIPGIDRLRDYRGLLTEVDSALARLDAGLFGQCERCHDPIEPERLAGDPLARVCLQCLTAAEQRALERDLELAAVVQRGLLPSARIESAGWEIEHRYVPLGPVSGDYCDVLCPGASGGPLHVILGDVSGKGVSASILMAHLQAVFRSLASLDLPLADLVGRANRIFCNGVVGNTFSTLLLGRLWPDGTLEVCNAGHCPPLVVHGGEVSAIAPTGLPLGLFGESEFGITRFRLDPGQWLFLYTDGLSETTNESGEAYGARRVETLAGRLNGGIPGRALDACLAEVGRFRGDEPRTDDLTLMMIRRRG